MAVQDARNRIGGGTEVLEQRGETAVDHQVLSEPIRDIHATIMPPARRSSLDSSPLLPFASAPIARADLSSAR